MAEEKESKWEVGPAKDVVEAFIVTLVDPRLPYNCFITEPPSQDDQRSVARQMHAVVLLYNYYHRKQKPELEFIDYVSFCKLALSLRSALAPFMESFHGTGSEAVELIGGEDNLSVTEKAIKSACDIAFSLDASKDVMFTEGYPISTVSVLLIDAEKENCLLQSDAVTEGVRSLIEKEVDQEVLEEERASKKRKVNKQQPFLDHSRFLEIGFDAVKDVAGINVSDLVVLEAHVVYSLSKEKSAAQFYLMKCDQSFDISKSFALDSLVESLQGPFAEKYLDTWMTTDLVQYHRLLPYAELISDWLPRKDLSVPILSDCIAQIIKNKEARKIASSRIQPSPFAEYGIVDFYINSSNTERKGKGDRDSKAYQKRGKVASPVEFFHGKEKHGKTTYVSKTRAGHANAYKDSVNNGKGDDASGRKENTTGISKVPFPSGEKENISTTQDDANGPNEGLGSKEIPRRKTIPLTRGKKKTKSNLRSHDQSKNISSTQHDADDQKNGVSSKVETADLFTSNDYQYRDETLTAENGDTTISGSRDERATAEVNTTIHFEALHNTQVENVMHSEDLQNAFQLLNGKRQELCSRLCTTEDTLALYEHVIDRLRDGGEVGLARQCIKSLLSGNDHLVLQNEVQAQGNAREDHSTPQSEKETLFSNIYLPGKSSCQDLEYACLKNRWTLPRYFVQPSDGKFLSNVMVHCTGATLTLTSKGGAKISPVEARESAAAQMIEKIQARS